MSTLTSTSFFFNIDKKSILLIKSNPFPTAGILSTIVTRAPLLAKYSTTSSPTAPPPITPIFLPSNFIASNSLIFFINPKIDITFSFSLSTTLCNPVIGGNRGFEPVAFTTTSGFKFSIASIVAVVLVNIYKFFNFLALFIK